MMKKEYKTPFLIMESFQLNAAIAAVCSSEIETSPDIPGDSLYKGALGYSEFACVPKTGWLADIGFFCDGICKEAAVNNPENSPELYVCYHGPIVYTDIAIYS